MTTVGPITLCCGNTCFQKSKDSECGGSGKDNWISERFSLTPSALQPGAALFPPDVLHTSSQLRERKAFSWVTSACVTLHQWVTLVFQCFLLNKNEDISVVPFPHLAVLIGTDPPGRSTAELCRGTGGDYGGFLGAGASGCPLCHPMSPALLPPARLGCALCCRRQGLPSICAFLSAGRRVPCHCTSLTWAIALLSACRGRKE